MANKLSVNLPELTSVDKQAFHTYPSLVNIDLPMLTSTNQAAFGYCDELISVNLPKVTTIANYTFRDCLKLTKLILRGDSVCTLSGVGAFTNTPIASGTGYIYVPSALIDSYKAASNWSTYAEQFRALEDYAVDGTTTGELDENKI